MRYPEWNTQDIQNEISFRFKTRKHLSTVFHLSPLEHLQQHLLPCDSTIPKTAAYIWPLLEGKNCNKCFAYILFSSSYCVTVDMGLNLSVPQFTQV